MKWEEARKLYPNRFVKIQVLKLHKSKGYGTIKKIRENIDAAL